MAETGTQGRDTRVFEIHTTEDSTRHTVSFQEENIFEQTPAKVYPMRLVPWFASHKAVVAGDGQYLVYNDGHLHWYDISATMETEIEPHTFSHLPAYGEGYVFSPPRAGWLYVRSVDRDTDAVTWHEYEVKANGTLHKCHWTEDEVDADYRPANDIRPRHLSMNFDGYSYDVGYSEVQWSWQFFQDIDQDEELRGRHMHPVTVDGVTINNETIALPEAQNAHLVVGDPAYDGYVTQTVRELAPDGYILPLFDALGVADTLMFEVAHAWLKMYALLAGLRNGVDPAEIETELLRNPHFDAHIMEPGLGVSESIDAARQRDYRSTRTQLSALHDLATLHYQVVYGSAEAEEKYGDLLDRPRLETLLGHDARAEVREIITDARQALIEYMQDPLYANALAAYAANENMPERQLDGKMRAMVHIKAVTKRPEADDRMLELPPDPDTPLPPDAGIQFVREIADGLYPDIATVIEQEVVVEELIAHTDEEPGAPPSNRPMPAYAATAGKVIMSLDSILNATTRLVEEIPDFLTIQMRWMQGVMLQIDNKAIALVEVGEIGRVIDEARIPIAEQGRHAFRVTEMTDEIAEIEIGEQIRSARVVRRSVQIDQAFQRNPTMVEEAVGKLVNNPKWGRFVAGVSVFNLGLTLLQLGQNALSNNRSIGTIGRDAAETFGAVVDVIAAKKSLTILMNKPMMAADAVKAAGRVGAKFAGVAAFIGAGVTTYDSVIRLTERDYDAGAMYGASAVFGVLVGIGAFAGWPALLMIGLIVAGTGTGIAAGFLTDAPLERFLKNFLFRDFSGFKWPWQDRITPPRQPDGWDNAVKHYERRTELISGRFQREDWQDFPTASRLLRDILFGARVSFWGDYEASDGDDSSGRLVAIHVYVRLSVFDPRYSELTAPQLRYYPVFYAHNADGSPLSYETFTAEPTGDDPSQIVEYKLTESGYHAHLTYRMTAGQVEMYNARAYAYESQVLFVARYRYNQSVAFPSPKNGVDQSFGALVPAHLVNWKPKMLLGTVSELEDHTNWEGNNLYVEGEET